MRYRGDMLPPPMPDSAEDQQRWRFTALAYRMLYNRFDADLDARVLAEVGPERAGAWRPYDRSSNPYRQVWEQLATLYDQEPEIIGPSPDVLALIAESGYWSASQRLQRDILGLRDLPVLYELDDEGSPRSHVIWPQYATVDVHPRRPTTAIAVHWWEPDPYRPSTWVQYHIDPRRIVDGEGGYWATDTRGSDITMDVIGTNIYPWIGQDGPIQPVVFRHAAMSGMAWDPYFGKQIVEGGLSLSVLFTHYAHVVRHATWAQRWALGVRPRGATTTDGGARQVVADPATLLQLEQDEDATSPQVGQWTAATDAEKLVKSILLYERRLMDQAIGGVAVSRQQSDVRSGMALAVSRDSLARAEARFAPVFRADDRRAIAIWSSLLGAATGKTYPTTWPATTGRTRQSIFGNERPEYDIEYAVTTPIAGA